MFDAVVEAYARLGGNVSAVARELGVHRSTVQYHLRKSDIYDPARTEDDPIIHGNLDILEPDQRAIPETGHKTYIFTSAQNNTRINEALWENLLALTEHHDAELIVGTYSYNINAYGVNTKRGHEEDGEEGDGLWYDPRLLPYIEAGDDLNIMLADTLQWCGRANLMPTAVNPLSGFETYCGAASGIFPHAKFALQSLPVMKGEPARMNYTTGTVTQRNYIARKAGLKAEHHHAYGALIVEVDSDGDWFVRQLNADSDGRICDLDYMVENGEIVEDIRAAAITWGDIHYSKMDKDIEELNWAGGGIADYLEPQHQFIHDLVDFEARRHHNSKDPHVRFKLFCEGQDSVRDEMANASDFLENIKRDDCKTVVVDSNHDNDLDRWLREADYREDPANAHFFLLCQLAKYYAIHQGEEHHSIEWVMTEVMGVKDVKFLRPDESYIVEGIEQGMHGHLGPNGARGTPRNLSKITSKANTGHTHSASIIDGCYTAGVSGKLEQGYNVGPSSWTNSHVVTYQNGKRAIITIRNGKWRAN